MGKNYKARFYFNLRIMHYYSFHNFSVAIPPFPPPPHHTCTLVFRIQRKGLFILNGDHIKTEQVLKGVLKDVK